MSGIPSTARSVMMDTRPAPMTIRSGWTTGVEDSRRSVGALKTWARPGAARSWVPGRIALDIGEGAFVTILGPSGAGKSTLLAILGMLAADWSGEYQLVDHAVHALPPRGRVELNKKYVGFVFQQFHL